MIRKIAAFVTVFMMLLSICAAAAFNDVDNSSEVGNAVEQLSNLGIINGYGDGNFYPDETLTRAQFSKIAVCMLGEEKSAQSRKNNNIFSDVSSDNWASGYINYIAERGIINGYPDGTFGAEDTINYAQALTIIVRLLGYSGEDVGYRWPDGYISLAQSLGVTKNMSFGTYENLTRGNAAYIVYNALLADKKENSSVSLLSSESIEDVVIYGDWETNASLSNGNIATTAGTYKLADASNIEKSVYGYLGTLYLDSEKKATAFVPEKEKVRNITIVSAAYNNNKVEITFTENSNTKTESFGANAPLYYEGKQTTLEGDVSKLEAGREAVLFFTENNVFERMYLKESSLSGPVTILSGYSQIYSDFDISNTTTLSVVRNGVKASVESISPYDVVYYMKGNNTIYAYTDKVSGTYEKAYPFKSNVTSVLVAGKEYTLSTQAAIRKMNESEGAFQLGDRVTLLFGRDGEVVDVVDMNSSGNLDLAVLTECYSEISSENATEGQYKRYAIVMLPDGGEVTYEVDRDYSDYVGGIVKVSYSQAGAKLSVVPGNSIYGEFNQAEPSLDGIWLSDDCNILELLSNDGEKAVVKKINIRDIDSLSLSKQQVIHAVRGGAMNDIVFLYVTDVTKSSAQFGVVINTESRTVGSGSVGTKKKYYTILTDGGEITVSNQLALSNGMAVEIYESSEGTAVKKLVQIGAGGLVDGYSSGRIRIGGTTYSVSDYVEIYGGTRAENYHSMSVNELLDSDNVEYVTLYSDKSLNSGGKVRVIIVRTKK